MAAKIVHFEIMGSDGESLKTFYSDLFEWNPQATEGFNNYFMVDDSEAGVGGAVGQGSEEMPNYLTIYLEVDDIDAQLDKIADAGGKTLLPKTSIPDLVTFALFTDPAGNTVGLVESD